MPSNRYFALALLALVLAGALVVYGMWLYIIQTNGGAYYSGAAVFAIVSGMLFVAGLIF